MPLGICLIFFDQTEIVVYSGLGGMMMVFFIIGIWLAFGYLAFCLQKAFFVRKYPEQQNDEYELKHYVVELVFFSICGLLTFIAWTMFAGKESFKYGLKLSRKYEE